MSEEERRRKIKLENSHKICMKAIKSASSSHLSQLFDMKSKLLIFEK